MPDNNVVLWVRFTQKSPVCGQRNASRRLILWNQAEKKIKKISPALKIATPPQEMVDLYGGEWLYLTAYSPAMTTDPDFLSELKIYMAYDPNKDVMS